MPDQTRLRVMHDLMDSQLETRDERNIGRVDDLAAEWRADGSLVLTDILVGPQAVIGRSQRHLRRSAKWLLRGRFDCRIPLGDAESIGPTIRLRQDAAHYSTGRLERWLAHHVIRHVPWSGSP